MDTKKIAKAAQDILIQAQTGPAEKPGDPGPLGRVTRNKLSPSLEKYITQRFVSLLHETVGEIHNYIKTEINDLKNVAAGDNADLQPLFDGAAARIGEKLKGVTRKDDSNL